MKQLNNALFVSFALIVLFGAAFAYDYFRKLERSIGTSGDAGPRPVAESDLNRPRSTAERRAEALAPAARSAEELNSVLQNNRSGLLDTSLPDDFFESAAKPLPIEGDLE